MCNAEVKIKLPHICCKPYNKQVNIVLPLLVMTDVTLSGYFSAIFVLLTDLCALFFANQFRFSQIRWKAFEGYNFQFVPFQFRSGLWFIPTHKND